MSSKERNSSRRLAWELAFASILLILLLLASF
jgi:hypothetical protein